MIRKLFRHLKIKYFLKNFKPSIKGECLYDYCKKMLSNNYTDKDYISAYEDEIKKLMEVSGLPRDKCLEFYILIVNATR